MEPQAALALVADAELLRRLVDLVAQSRRVEADIVAHIGEVDARRLFARQAFPSMFAYCTEGLRLSEAEAYRRITVARAARRFPMLLEMLRDGRVHLSGMARLVPLLTPENSEALLARARHLTTRQVEALVAELAPRPDVPALIRKLPPLVSSPTSPVSLPAPLGASDAELVSRPATPALPPELVARRVETPTAPPSKPSPAPSRPTVEALAPARYKVQFTAGVELRDKLERLAALLRSDIQGGDLADAIDYAVTRRSKGSKLDASARRSHLEGCWRRVTHPRSRGTSRRRCAVRCTSATAAAAVSSTSRAGAARSGTGSSSITGIPSALAATTAPATSACFAVRTTVSSPSTITGRPQWSGTWEGNGVARGEGRNGAIRVGKPKHCW